MNLTRVAITRPVFMLMLMLAAIFIGRLSYNSMRVEQNPDVQFGVITVTTGAVGTCCALGGTVTTAAQRSESDRFDDSQALRRRSP